MSAPFRPPHTPGSGKVADYQKFKGTDWSMSIHRPGCQDHLLCPSRRGDERVMHKGPIGMSSTRREIDRGE